MGRVNSIKCDKNLSTARQLENSSGNIEGSILNKNLKELLSPEVPVLFY